MKVKLPFCFILLMITSVAWADSKVLWRGNSQSCGEHFHSTPEAARKACGYTRKGWKMEKRGEFTYEMGWYNEDGSFYKWTGAYVLGKTQSCELKDVLSHNGDNIFTLNLPYSENGAPKMLRRCINNCEREFRRIRKMGESANTEESGSLCIEIPNPNMSSFCTSSYTAIQTGAVCTLKPGEKDDTQYDDVTNQPTDDNGNTGADGKGMDGDSGKNNSNNPEEPPKQDGRDDSKTDNGTSGSNGSGNQSGGQGGTGADSPRDSGSADEPVEDKDKPGKGKGKGGRGGGNYGQKDDQGKDDKGDKKDGKEDQGKGDKKDSKEDPGEGDKKDGKEDPGEGTGTDGDKNGKGSGISGGDCKSGKAPSCKGET